MRRIKLYVLGMELKDKPSRDALMLVIVDAYLDPNHPSKELPSVDAINLVCERIEWGGDPLYSLMLDLCAFRMSHLKLRSYSDELPREFVNRLAQLLASKTGGRTATQLREQSKRYFEDEDSDDLDAGKPSTDDKVGGRYIRYMMRDLGIPYS